MNSAIRRDVANKSSQYLCYYSKARHFFLVDPIDRKFSSVYHSALTNTIVKSNPRYLLYRCYNPDQHVFIANHTAIGAKEKVCDRKYVPTFITQRTFKIAGEVDAGSLLQKVRVEFYTTEEENLAKIMQIAFRSNVINNGNVNVIKSKSLKEALAKANNMLRSRVRLIDALSKSNDMLGCRVDPNLKFNVLSNVSLNISDIRDDIGVQKNKIGLKYGDNTIHMSEKIPGNSLYVVPTQEHLGVMPIIYDVQLTLDKDNIIAFYEIGMSVLNTNNIIKIELEY